jgi:Flp pilus assembly protein TadG
MIIFRLKRCQRGSTAVEFALVSPLVIMLILAALEFGMAFRANAGLRNLAGWAGRGAIVATQVERNGESVDTAAVRASIIAEAARKSYNLGSGVLAVTVSNTQDTSLLTVHRIRVRLVYTHPISVPFLPVSSVPMTVDRTFFAPNT